MTQTQTKTNAAEVIQTTEGFSQVAFLESVTLGARELSGAFVGKDGSNAVDEISPIRLGANWRLVPPTSGGGYDGLRLSRKSRTPGVIDYAFVPKHLIRWAK